MQPPRQPHSESPDDARELARRVAGGDRAAFERLHDRLAPGLTRLFLRKTGGRAELSDELVQQTWAEFWRLVRSGRYDPARAAPSTVAYAVASNVWLRHCRAAATRQAETAMEEAPTGSEPHLLLQHAELLDALRACIENSLGPYGLDAEEREIVREAARGVTERTLAARLGLAASTVNVRKREAYVKIRRCLAAKGFADEIVEQIPLALE